MTEQQYVFEIFVIDFKEKALCPDAGSLLHFVQACRSLWANGSPEQAGGHSATDGAITVTVTDETGLGQPALSKKESATKSFTVTTTSDFDGTARSRRVLLEHIAKAGFSDKYILRDDVSAKIAKDLYPYLYKIENSLRRYVAKFMCVKVGQGWFNTTVSRIARDSLAGC